MTTQSTATALLLFVLVMPVFTFFLQPLTSLHSRQHEFEADAYAAAHASAADLVQALVKLYQDNAVDADARPAALGVLRLASAGRAPASPD